MSVSIKVAVRCRPFTIDDDLGVNLTQCGEEEGEVSIFLLSHAQSTIRPVDTSFAGDMAHSRIRACHAKKEGPRPRNSFVKSSKRNPFSKEFCCNESLKNMAPNEISWFYKLRETRK